MNFIRKNFKHLLVAITTTFFTLMLGLGLGLSAFGMGMDSQRFINSVDKTIDKYLTKGNIVIDGKGMFYGVATKQLKESYATDVLSTLSDDQKTDEAIKFWQDYANEKFDQRWKAVIDNKEDIDINEFSHALVKFDTQVAKEFHNYGFTHSGLQWIGQKGALSDLLSSNYISTKTYQEANRNQTIINQEAYTNGTYLVNNKVWFINEQIKTLTNPLIMNVVFKDKEAAKSTLMKLDENGQETPIQVSASDFYHPNYTKGFEQTRAGAVFLVILTPIFGLMLIGSTVFSYYLFDRLTKTKKETKVVDNELVLEEKELLS